MDNKVCVEIQNIMLRNQMMTGSKCPACGDKKMITDENTGELFCGKCGFVIIIYSFGGL